jgi:hypothetical protein
MPPEEYSTIINFSQGIDSWNRSQGPSKVLNSGSQKYVGCSPYPHVRNIEHILFKIGFW